MKHIKNHIQLILLSIFTLSVFLTSCREEEMYELSLSTNYIEINEGEVSTVPLQIENSNGRYTVSSSPAGIVTATLSENSIVVTAHTSGQTVLTITDRTGKKTSLDIVVTDPAIATFTSYFSWKENTIRLEHTNNWGLTIFPEQIAVTNIANKSQYILSWNGNLSTGVETNGILKIIKDGVLNEIILLTKVSVIEVDDEHYTIVFNKENEAGKIVIAK